MSLFTRNSAEAIGLGAKKGSLEAGKDADLIILDRDFRLVSVMVKGAWAVKDGVTLLRNAW